MGRKILYGLAGAALLLPATAFAATNPHFDVETATRAYLDLLQGPARARSDAYFEGGYWLILWNAVVAVLGYVVLLRTGLSARFRDRAERIVKWRWLVPAAYALPFVIASTLIFLPWTIYTDFLREQHYGLMSQSFGAWLVDQGKSLGISIVANAILLTALFAVIRGFRRTWWLWGAGVMTGLFAFGALLGPLIAPMFNSYTELPAGPIRDRIVAMAAANHIPAEHVYLFDASKQSKRISANVSGLGPTIRISLNDNLLNRTGPDEVAAVMGHEMGHYVLGHVVRMILLFALVFIVVFGIIYRVAPAVIARNPRWGVRDIADPAATPVLALIAAIASLVLTPIQNLIVRTAESQADAFGLDAAREPDGFAKIAMRLSEYRKIEPGPIEEALFFDHPSGATRVRMAMQWKKDHVPGATMVKPDIKLDAK
ncbi:M48 family metallopeptidase [Sphingomonas oligophenolica]|uniref:M48 family metallopeptidase n=1 Tax=Sphingomonas oligophenolica TaxID=301154 RepID=A0ABU9Y9E5_9SPHN